MQFHSEGVGSLISLWSLILVLHEINSWNKKIQMLKVADKLKLHYLKK